MKIARFFYLCLGVLISNTANTNGNSNHQAASASEPPTKTLKYQIVKGSANTPDKIKINLEGSGYETGKFCRIMRSNDAEIAEAISSNSAAVAAAFTSIGSCSANENSVQNNCVVACTTIENTITYENLSPRTKYVYVYVGTSANDAEGKVKGVGSKVFGYSIPLLANPQITVSTETNNNNKQLQFATKTCARVNCPIYYKDIQYELCTKGGNCNAENTANKVDFDLLLPHYEVRCDNYPSFFYYMPNQYMKKSIDIYEPQFYVVKKTGSNVGIKFTNSPSSEICLFSIKNGQDSETGESYTSVCGGTDKMCYAPCKYVELNGIAGKKFFKILIQTRHHDIKATGNSLDGYKQTKFAFTELSAPNEGLLSSYTNVGVTFDGTSLKAGSDPKMTKCTLQHYFAYRPKPTTQTDTTCDVSTTEDNKCRTDCTKLVIQALTAGKAYMIDIAFEGSDSIPAGFKEHIFIRTKNEASKSFSDTAATKTDTTVSLTAMAATTTSPQDKKDEPTCEYLVSPTGLASFFHPKCNGNTPCRGICSEQVTVEDLEPNKPYDIRVIAHKDYDIKDYTNIRTTLTTLTITHKITLDGLSLKAQLNAVDPSAICSYIIKKKNGNDYTDYYTCPEVSKVTTPVTAPVAPAPVVASSSKLSSTDLNIARIAVPMMTDGGLISAAKSSVPGNSDTQPTGADNSINACSSNPLCSSIRFPEYEAANTYKILVTAIGKSSEKEHIIDSSAPKVNPTDSSKLISVVITRDGNSFIVTTTYPATMNDKSKCKWELRNSSVKSNAVVKSCMGRNVDGCTAFETCKEFKLNDLPDGNNYYLTVYSAQDNNIFGGADIQQGAKSSSGDKTKLIIIIASVAVVVVVAIVGIVVLKKKRD